MLSTWVLNESFESILTPKSLSCVLLFISLFSTVKLTFLLVLHLSGFDFIWLSLNYWNSVFKAFCSLTINSCMLFPTAYGVLPSVWLANSVLFIIMKRPQRKIFNKRGPNMEPWGTPKQVFFPRAIFGIDHSPLLPIWKVILY